MKFVKKPAVLIVALGAILYLATAGRWLVSGTCDFVDDVIRDGPSSAIAGPIIPGQDPGQLHGFLPPRAGFGAWFHQDGSAAPSPSSFIGTWRNGNGNMIIVLNEDGTGSAIGHRLNWKTLGADRISITDEQGHSVPARVGGDGKSLVIDPDGPPGVLIRQ
jgi:hypothetical protein